MLNAIVTPLLLATCVAVLWWRTETRARLSAQEREEEEALTDDMSIW
jgi:glucose-6-phosphate dehydrogenase assembly protein OpcA